MIVNRHIINKDVRLYDTQIQSWLNYDDLCSLINRVINTFIANGAKKGDKVALIQHRVNPVHIASVFACFELGLEMVIADVPTTKESLPYCKLALRGPIDYTIYDEEFVGISVKDGRPWLEMIYQYGGVVLSDRDISNDSTLPHLPDITSNDICLWSSSSGTTSWSKPVSFSHNEVLMISKRNITIFNYSKSDIVAQTKNLHHGGSLLISFLPALMACDRHILVPLSDTHREYRQFINYNKQTIRDIYNFRCNRVTITNEDVFDLFLQTAYDLFGRFATTLTIIPFVFKSTSKLVEQAKKHNVEIHNTYGSVDSHMIPLAVNKIKHDTVFVDNYVGDWIDDGFYNIHSINQGVHTFERIDGRLCTIEDVIDIKDGKVFLYNRSVDGDVNARQQVLETHQGDFAIVQDQEKKYLALFDDLPLDDKVTKIGFNQIRRVDKTLFYTEAKINYDALRGHFNFYDRVQTNTSIFEHPHVFVVFRPGACGNFISTLIQNILDGKNTTINLSKTGHAHNNDIAKRKSLGIDYLSLEDSPVSLLNEIDYFKAMISTIKQDIPHVTWTHNFNHIPYFRTLFPNCRIVVISDDTLRERLTTLAMHVEKNLGDDRVSCFTPLQERRATYVINSMIHKAAKMLGVQPSTTKAQPLLMYFHMHYHNLYSLIYKFSLDNNIPYFDDHTQVARDRIESSIQFSAGLDNKKQADVILPVRSIFNNDVSRIVTVIETVINRSLDQQELCVVENQLGTYVNKQNPSIWNDPIKYITMYTKALFHS